MRHHRRVSYALSRPARSPTGAYYEVAASPRGDLLLWFSETGPGTGSKVLPDTGYEQDDDDAPKAEVIRGVEFHSDAQGSI
jgi:hypothetical protein